MRCKNCGKAIKASEPYPIIGGFITTYYHENDSYYCETVLPTTPLPKCHICKSLTDIHGSFCSAVGFPAHNAELMLIETQ